MCVSSGDSGAEGITSERYSQAPGLLEGGRSLPLPGAELPAGGPQKGRPHSSLGTLHAMPALVIGPLLRYVGENCAVIWVETDGPCEVTVLGCTEPTFHVEGHHYALVRIEGIEPGTLHEYTVELDGGQVWPPANSEFPPSRFRTYPKDAPLKIAFGSCRVAPPTEPPDTLSKDEDERGRGIDALRTLALRMRDEDPEQWPDLFLFLGDQVYADEIPPNTEKFVRARRDTSEEPGTIAQGFEE